MAVCRDVGTDPSDWSLPGLVIRIGRIFGKHVVLTPKQWCSPGLRGPYVGTSCGANHQYRR